MRRLRRDRHRPRGVSASESAPDYPLRHPRRSSGRRLRSLPTDLPRLLHCLEVKGLASTWTEQVCLLSTSAITTVPEHDSESDHSLARLLRGFPLAWRCCEQRFALRRAAGRAARVQGPTYASRCRRHLPSAKAGGASPQTGFSPDTPCRAPMSTLAGEASADSIRTESS